MRTAAGLILFVLFVGMPIRASLTAATTVQSGIDGNAKAAVLEYALSFDRCNAAILEMLGDTLFIAKNFIGSANAYGRGMQCSPGNASMRFKYGESVLALGFVEGDFSVNDAVTLEPHNPIYSSEMDRLKEHRLRLQ